VYVPGEQAAHARSLVGDGRFATWLPASQSLHGTQGVAGFKSLSHVPPPHATAAAISPAQYWPAAHASQTGALVAVPAAVCTVPAGHALAERHMDWFATVVLLPVGQAAHARSLAADGRFVT
jgi:hypothetical protein